MFEHHPRRFLHRVAGFALTACCVAGPALASVIPLPIQELVRHSTVVVQAEVLETSSAHGEWVTGGDVIYTTALIEVGDVIHGEAPRQLEVTCIGGTVDGVTLKASGAPGLQPGETVVLFLKEFQHKYWITGMENGKYDVVGDLAVNTGHATARRLPLATLKNEVRDAVRQLELDR